MKISSSPKSVLPHPGRFLSRDTPLVGYSKTIMPFLQFLLLASSLSAPILAAPSHLMNREDQRVTGVVPYGVNCATAHEPLHSLSADTLAQYIDSGIDYADPLTAGRRYFKAEFDPSTQLNPAYQAVDWASGCDVTQGLYAFSVAYEGTCMPQIYNNLTPLHCDGEMTPDIVVFNVGFTTSGSLNRQTTYATSAKYCATLTNSDGGPPDGSRPYYRQCMNNAAPAS